MKNQKLEIKDLNFSFGSKSILSKINFTFLDSNLYVISGPSGQGKSTLLNLLAGHLTATSGSIWLNAETISRPTRKVILISQENDLFPWSTIDDQFHQFENLGGNASVVQELLDLFELTEYLKKYPSELSIGTQKRFQLVRSLMFSPQVLLLDETLSSIDSQLREKILNYLIKWMRETCGILIVVSHFENELFGKNQINLQLKLNELRPA